MRAYNRLSRTRLLVMVWEEEGKMARSLGGNMVTRWTNHFLVSEVDELRLRLGHSLEHCELSEGALLRRGMMSDTMMAVGNLWRQERVVGENVVVYVNNNYRSGSVDATSCSYVRPYCGSLRSLLAYERLIGRVREMTQRLQLASLFDE